MKHSNSDDKTYPCKALIYYFWMSRKGNHFDTSSIHGLNHLTSRRRNFLERLLWLTLLALCIFGTVYLSNTTWTRYQDSPIVVSMERDMYAWNTTFPSITLCTKDVLDEKKLDSYVKKSKTQDKELLKNFLRNLSIASYNTFDTLESVDEIPSSDYMQLILNLSKTFEPKMTVGAPNVVLKLVPTITEFGLCYSVNSRAAVYNSPRVRTALQTIIFYWRDHFYTKQAIIANYRADNRKDFINNKDETFYIHPLDGEMFAQIMNIASAYEIFIHGAEEVPDISSKGIYSANGFYMKVYVTALTIYTSKDAASLNVAQRKCRFPNERVLKYSVPYSYTLCRIDCRIEACLDKCGCIPHFYHNEDNAHKVCDVQGLHCLARQYNYLYSLKEDGKKPGKVCKCLPLCDDVYYVLQSSVLQEWYLGTNLQWGIVTYPRMRYRRDIIFGFTDVLVSVGGMAGLFLGCSVLSFMEIVYFVTLRLFWFIVKQI